MFRRIRIAILLLILAIVGLNTWTDALYSTSWKAPMTVALFPINADQSPATDEFIKKLSREDFTALEEFIHEEANEYGVKVDHPVRITLAPMVRSMPPERDVRAGALGNIVWSLRFRWWAWRVPKAPGPTPRVRLFLCFYDPAKHKMLDHSVGLQKGLIGLVKLFADARMQGSNLVVTAHELLHTYGATDKYGPDTLPIYPSGYAEPDREPRYPQRFAELMGGRIPVSPTDAKIPESLRQVVVGSQTAREIGWLKN